MSPGAAIPRDRRFHPCRHGQTITGDNAMMAGKLCRGLLCLTFLPLSGCGGPSAADEVVRIESGLLSGIQGTDPSIRVFKGIPYAAPPIFDLRWRPPQPPDKWEGVYKADRTCAICMQQG